MVDHLLSTLRHRKLARELARARAGHDHVRALDVLRRELYGDLTRPMAEIYLDMAHEDLALGRPDTAASRFRLIDDTHLSDASRTRRRYLGVCLLIAQGKLADAESRLSDLDEAHRALAARDVAAARNPRAPVDAADAERSPLASRRYASVAPGRARP